MIPFTISCEGVQLELVLVETGTVNRSQVD